MDKYASLNNTDLNPVPQNASCDKDMHGITATDGDDVNEKTTNHEFNSGPVYSKLPEKSHNDTDLEEVTSVPSNKHGSQTVHDSRDSLEKDNFAPLCVCLLVCLVVLIFLVLALTMAVVLAWVWIVNIRSDLDLIMETSETTNQSMVSQDALKKNITKLEIEIQIFWDKIEELDALTSNITWTINTLGRRLTELHNETAECQNSVEVILTEFIIRQNANLDNYTLNLTEFLNMFIQNFTQEASVSLISARGAQRSVDDLESKLVQDIQQIYEFDSCDTVNMLSLPFPSGEYLITSSIRTIRAYCMFSCNGVSGGWRRIAYLNTSDPNTADCPEGLEQVGSLESSNNPLSCRRSSDINCTSVLYSTDSSNYSRVCGRINAHQLGSPDGFRDYPVNTTSIEDNYLDGVSLTYGMNPKNHIWTLIALVTMVCQDCSSKKPIFVESYYSCENNQRCFSHQLACLSDVLWNGDQCIGGAWFLRNLSNTTSDDIEMRVCTSQGRGDEDLWLSLVEIYVY